MKILIVFRKKEGEAWEIIKNLAQNFEKLGHEVEMFSREEDLGINSLSDSMGPLKEAIRKKNAEKNYDMIYTQDWSIAMPLLIPERVFEDKHYSFFHNIQNGAKSKILQKIVGKMLGGKLVTRTEELKKQFPKSALVSDGIFDSSKKQ